MPAILSDEDRAGLEKARATGILTIEAAYGRVTYRSLEEIDKILARDDEARAQAAGTSSSRSVVRFGRGGYAGCGRSFERGGW